MRCSADLEAISRVWARLPEAERRRLAALAAEPVPASGGLWCCAVCGEAFSDREAAAGCCRASLDNAPDGREDT